MDYRYDPYNISSPLFGKLTGGKIFRVSVRTMTDAIYPLMAGVLDEPVSLKDNRVPKARLKGSDGWTFLRSQKNEVTIPLQEDIYVDDAMMLVLQKAGWPRMWGSELDAGVDLRDYFWVDSRSAAQVIHELAFNELGTVSMQGDGRLRFRSRVSQEAEALVITEDDCLPDGITRMTPAEVIRNLIKVESEPRSEQIEQTVWELTNGLQIGASETISDVWAEFTYNNETVPVKDPVTPVITTDYTAWQNSDKTGTDLTANITITMNPFSTRGQLTVTNSGLSAAYVFIKIRGKPIPKLNKVTFEYKDESSIQQFGARPFVLTVDQNINVARQYRELLGLFLTSARNYLVVDLLTNPDLQFGIDLGQIIRAEMDSYGVNQAFRVIGIKHEFKDVNGIVVNTRWWLEPYSRLFAGVQIPFQVPFQLGGVL
jgi:hypothetical protein